MPGLFSHRTSWTRAPNALALRREALERAGAALIDLTESNPTRCFDYPQAELADAFARAPLVPYRPEPFGLPEAREALARELGGQLPPESLILTASTSEAYAYLFKLLCDPGDRVLVPRPSYPLFEFLAGLEGVELASFELLAEADFGIDLESLERAATPLTRAVLLVHPGNPTGQFLKRAEWASLSRLCADHGWAVICDEVFLDYGRGEDPDRLGSLALEPTEALTFVLSGLSKRCGLPQVKLGWLSVHGPAADVRESYARLELIADTYLSVGTPVQAALPRLLEIGAGLREAIRARVADNRAVLAAAIPTDAPISLVASEGGWSALLRLPEHADEEAVCAQLLDAGVVVQPGYFYDFPRRRYLVVSLLPRPEVFADGIRRLVATLGSSGSA